MYLEFNTNVPGVSRILPAYFAIGYKMLPNLAFSLVNLLDDVALLQIAVLQQDLLERDVEARKRKRKKRLRRYQTCPWLAEERRMLYGDITPVWRSSE